MAFSVPPGFSVRLPVDVRFRREALGELQGVLDSLHARRWAAIVDPALLGLDSVSAQVDAADAVFAIPAGEPTIESVDRLGGLVAEEGIDAVVAIGGGSALDSGKGARLVADHGHSVGRYCWPGEPAPIPAPRTPLVCVPTTAGTGSEVTGGVVVADPARGIKAGAASPNNRAQVALVDPCLTYSLPPEPTLHGGVDVIAQAIGAVVAVTRSPVADGIALESLRLAREALPAVMRDPHDEAARSAMSCASMMAGLAMNLSEVGSEHSLGHAVGAVAGVPHGLSVGVMLIASMEHDRHAAPEVFERIADTLREPADGRGDGLRAIKAVAALLADVAFPTLADIGIDASDVPRLTDAALAAWIPGAPRRWGRSDVEDAYRGALRERRGVAGRAA